MVRFAMYWLALYLSRLILTYPNPADQMIRLTRAPTSTTHPADPVASPASPPPNNIDNNCVFYALVGPSVQQHPKPLEMFIYSLPPSRASPIRKTDLW
jgi:hypothetical protein